jgi:hypothetical protein
MKLTMLIFSIFGTWQFIFILIFLIVVSLFFLKSKNLEPALKPFEFSSEPDFTHNKVGSFLIEIAGSDIGKRKVYLALSLKYGLLLGITSFIINKLSPIDQDLELSTMKVIFSFVLNILLISLCLLQFRKINSGQLNIKTGLLIGGLIGLSAGLTTFICIYYDYEYNPTALIRSVEESTAYMEKHSYPQKSIDEFNQNFSNPITQIVLILISIISGVLVAVLPTYILKTK